MKKPLAVAIACALTLLNLICFAQTTLYIKPTAAGSADGSSWGNASNDLQAMLNLPGTNTIFVAAGTYKPVSFAGSGTLNRDKAFVITKRVTLYGGFAGTETDPALRTGGKTILSGDIDNNDATSGGIFGGNSNHVIIAAAADTVLLDRFSFSGGQAVGVDTITVNNRKVSPDLGGGIYALASVLYLKNCFLTGNMSTGINGGAGLYADSSAAWISNTQITGNYAAGGAAVYNRGSDPVFTNCTIASNKGGAIYNFASNPVLNNMLVAGNLTGQTNSPASEITIGYQNATESTNNTSTGAEAWSNPGNALTDNNSYATMANAALLIGGTVRTTNFLVLKNWGFSIEPNAVIKGIEVEVRRLSSDNTGSNYTRDTDIRLVKNNIVTGTNHANTGVNWTTTETAAVYGSNTDSWGIAFRGSDLNSPDFGVAISITSRAAGLLLPTVISYIDAVRVRVYYSPESNPAITYSMIQDVPADPGNNVLDGSGNPLFAAPYPYSTAPFTNGNYRVQPTGSPVDAGNTVLYTNAIGNVISDKDLAGNSRIAGSAVDLGAFESTGLVVPVKIISFIATNAGKAALLTWKTENEINLSRYEVEKSIDNIVFYKTGEVAAAGLSTYRFTEQDAFAGSRGTIYYRLKMADADGRFAYSDIQSLSYKNGEETIQIYPSPFTDQLKIVFDRNVSGSVQVIITDATGKPAMLKNFTNLLQSPALNITGLGSLPAGTYIVNIKTDEGTFVKKAVKK